jgi:hypothetical protein
MPGKVNPNVQNAIMINASGISRHISPKLKPDMKFFKTSPVCKDSFKSER